MSPAPACNDARTSESGSILLGVFLVLGVTLALIGIFYERNATMARAARDDVYRQDRAAVLDYVTNYLKCDDPRYAPSVCGASPGASLPFRFKDRPTDEPATGDDGSTPLWSTWPPLPGQQLVWLGKLACGDSSTDGLVLQLALYDRTTSSYVQNPLTRKRMDFSTPSSQANRKDSAGTRSQRICEAQYDDKPPTQTYSMDLETLQNYSLKQDDPDHGRPQITNGLFPCDTRLGLWADWLPNTALCPTTNQFCQALIGYIEAQGHAHGCPAPLSELITAPGSFRTTCHLSDNSIFGRTQADAACSRFCVKKSFDVGHIIACRNANGSIGSLPVEGVLESSQVTCACLR